MRELSGEENWLRWLELNSIQLRPNRYKERHYQLKNEATILELAPLLWTDFFLLTVVANDERELEDGCFKIYYLFSHRAEDVFLTVEVLLKTKSTPVTYHSLRDCFKAVIPFEQQLADFFGLYTQNYPQTGRVFLRRYKDAKYPLRRISDPEQPILPLEPVKKAPAGEFIMPVGPVHAGIIEPGRFLFQLSGEVVEKLIPELGYTHKGLEYLFQTEAELQTGWALAEQVSGDASFAHSLAYCQAVEALAGCKVPNKTVWLRGLLLEMERLVNHVGDTGALAQDVALEIFGFELAKRRELLMQAGAELTGSRFLRGLNRPGGLNLPKTKPFNAAALNKYYDTIMPVIREYLVMAGEILQRPDFRNRVLGVGILEMDKVLELGVVGMAARAAGVDMDFRRLHPTGAYADPKTIAFFNTLQDKGYHRFIIEESRGDIYSRYVQRMQEVDVSLKLIKHFIEQLQNSDGKPDSVKLDLLKLKNFEYALGYVESWRGPVIYWLMNDKFRRIYRCKVSDPSTLNWPGLVASVEPSTTPEWQRETRLADFPLINKSFNLSYSGNDL